MIELRPFSSLGGANHGWLNAKHHFSFASYYDPARMSHGALRVWNDDEIAPNTGFPAHPHSDMEIITYVREGAITHQDSLGNKGRTEAGDVQVMSAGSGIRHAEYNLEPVKTTLFQIWIEPTQQGGQPCWGAKPFPKGDRSGKFVALASGFKDDADALPIRAEARVLGTTLKAGESVDVALNDNHKGYLVPATGAVEISDGSQRLIVNCGGAALEGAWVPRDLAQGLRTTAAHSTLVLNDSNSTALLPDGTLGRGVTEVELTRQETDNGSRIDISHDGYVRRMGYVHRRLLMVSGDGREVRGEDMLTPAERRRKPQRQPVQLRFHLAPGVEPTLTADSQGAVLRIDSGVMWQFRTGAGVLSVEESLWVDGDGRPHPTRQLVVTGEALPGGSNIGWLFKRMG